jgi:hypothetical protein
VFELFKGRAPLDNMKDASTLLKLFDPRKKYCNFILSIAQYNRVQYHEEHPDYQLFVEKLRCKCKYVKQTSDYLDRVRRSAHVAPHADVEEPWMKLDPPHQTLEQKLLANELCYLRSVSREKIELSCGSGVAVFVVKFCARAKNGPTEQNSRH